MIAAAFVAKFLNDEFWLVFWASVPKLNMPSGIAYIPSEFPRSAYDDGDLKDPALRQGIGFFLQFILPALLLAAALLLRLRPWVFLILGIATLLVLTAAGSLLLAYKPPIEDFLQAMLFVFLASAIGATALSLAGPKHPDHPPEPVQVKAGVARNPLRAWLILAGGFLALQLAIPLATYLTFILREVLDCFYETWAWTLRYDSLVTDDLNDYNLELIRQCTLAVISLVLPFALLLLAIRLRLRPWYGWIMGLIVMALGFGAMGVLQTRMTFEEISICVVFSQLTGTITVLLLMLYHCQISRLVFDPIDD